MVGIQMIVQVFKMFQGVSQLVGDYILLNEVMEVYLRCRILRFVLIDIFKLVCFFLFRFCRSYQLVEYILGWLLGIKGDRCIKCENIDIIVIFKVNIFRVGWR